MRRLAADGDAEAVSALVEIAGERGEVAELRSLASTGARRPAPPPAETGSGHAAELLDDLTGD